MFSAHNKNSHNRRQCRPQEEAMSRALTAALAAVCLAFGPQAMAQFTIGPGGFGSDGTARSTTVKSSKSNTSDRMGGGGGGKGAAGRATTVKSSKSNSSDRMGGGGGGKGAAGRATTVKSSKSNSSDRMGGGGGAKGGAAKSINRNSSGPTEY
jgi:hypothetical protein